MKNIIRLCLLLMLLIPLTSVQAQAPSDIPQLDTTLTMTGHRNVVHRIIQFTNGRIISASADSTLRLWETDGTLVAVLEGHTSAVHNAVETREGHIASWGRDGTLRFWDENGAPLMVIEAHLPSFVMGGTLLDSGHLMTWGDQHIYWWNTQDGTIHREIFIPDDIALEARYLSDGRIISWGRSTTLYLTQFDGEIIAMSDRHESAPTGVLELYDGRIVSWGMEHYFNLWGIDGRHITRFEADDMEAMIGVTSLPNGNLLSWSEDGKLRLWSVSGTLLDTFGNHEGLILGALHMPNGLILAWSSDGAIVLYNRHAQTARSLSRHRRMVYAVTPLTEGRWLSRGSDATHYIRDADGHILMGLVNSTGSRMNAPLQLADGRLIASDDELFNLYIWDIDDYLPHLQRPIPLLPTVTLDTQPNRIQNVQRGPDGIITIRYTNGGRRDVYPQDTYEGKLLSGYHVYYHNNTPMPPPADGRPPDVVDIMALLGERASGVVGALQMPNGEIITWHTDRSIRRRNLETGFFMVLNPDQEISIANITLLPTGHLHLLTESGAMQIWDIDGTPLLRLASYLNKIDDVVFLDDGRILGYHAEHHIIEIWDIADYLERLSAS